MKPLRQTCVLGGIFFVVFSAYYVLQGYAAILLKPSLASNALATLYALFTLSCFISAGVVNRVGPKRALAVGVTGYCCFSAAIAVHIAFGGASWTAWLVMLGGGLNGLGAAILWTAQGRLMLDVAARDDIRDSGAHIGIFWAMFNSSAVLGGLATFFYFSRANAPGRSDPLIFGFTALIAIGGLGTSMLDDDTQVAQEDRPESSETLAALRLFATRRAALLAPVMWYTGFNQPYQLNGFGDRFFRPAVVGLELAVFYTASVVGGLRAGVHLDDKRRRVKSRAVWAVVVFAFLSAVPYALAAYLERNFNKPVGLSSLNCLLPSLVFALWGYSTAYIQAYLYWLIDQLYEDHGPERSRAVALYKLVQSAGWCAGYALLPSRRCPLQIQLALGAASCCLGTILALFELPQEGGPAPLLLDPRPRDAGYSMISDS